MIIEISEGQLNKTKSHFPHVFYTMKLELIRYMWLLFTRGVLQGSSGNGNTTLPSIGSYWECRSILVTSVLSGIFYELL